MAQKVWRELFIALNPGELLQNKLINVIAKALPDCDANTVNGLVRKSLSRENGHFVERREVKSPKRVYWCLTQAGLEYAYQEGLIHLHEFSGAITRTIFSVYTNALPIYGALARSRRLAELVESNQVRYYVPQDDKFQKAARFGFLMNRDKELGIARNIGLFYEVTLPVMNSVVSHLASNKDLRQEVGDETLSEIREYALAVAAGQKQQLQSLEQAAASLKPVSKRSPWRRGRLQAEGTVKGKRGGRQNQ